MSSGVDCDLAILGCGTMGEAILAGAIRANVLDPRRVIVTARRPERLTELSERHGVYTSSHNAIAAARAPVSLLAVKPQIAREVLLDPDLQGSLDGRLLVSIAAGTRLEQLARWSPGAQLIRAMPNTPCTIGEGMTVLSPGSGSTPEHLLLVRRLFEAVGRVRVLEERHLDVVTALSGSGPAFACVVIEALADGGVMMGLPRDVAIELAAQTVQGAGRLVLQTGTHPSALKDSVTTPAGCTIAGLLTMEDGRIRSTLARTIQEAAQVASSLGGPSDEP
ncbi:MAG: pyrroline-5-carboxylate reductase [Deltaproteobacteria bacterium]|nr:MAG: pyrroline-5-carboxylate reductase [Deltaproteobacteria bacterium]